MSENNRMIKKASSKARGSEVPGNKDGVKSWTTVVQDLTPSLIPGASLSRALLEAFLSILLFLFFPVAWQSPALEGFKNSFSAAC